MQARVQEEKDANYRGARDSDQDDRQLVRGVRHNSAQHHAAPYEDAAARRASAVEIKVILQKETYL